MPIEDVDMYDVVSSNVYQIGYDDINSILYVVFNNGYTYEYYNVPPEVWDNFMNAESKGRFVHTDLKYIYNYQRIY